MGKGAFMRLSGLSLIILLLLFSFSIAAGWDFSHHSVAVDEIMSGGPPQDGIPALLDPRFLPASEADFMQEGEQVFGVAIDGKARA